MNSNKLKLQRNHNFFNDNLPFLSKTLENLLDGKEKKYGCFRIVKEEGWYRLEIPYLPILRFYKNEHYHIYKIHWSEKKELYSGDELEDKDLSISIKKSQRKKYQTVAKSQIQVQKIYEIIIKNNFKEETRLINRILAKYIQNRIEENLTRNSGEDIHSLVTIVEAS